MEERLRPPPKKRKKDSKRQLLKVDYLQSFNLEERERNLSSAVLFQKGDRPQDQAIEFSSNCGLKPVFAVDVNGANKAYYVCSYEKMKKILITRKLHKSHFYEVTFPIPSKLFIDVDIDLKVNPAIRESFEELQVEFMKLTEDFFLERGLIKKRFDLEPTILDSSHGKKISRHYVFKIMKDEKKCFFRNPFHCGSFIRQLQNYIFEREGIDDPTQSRFWFKLKKPNNQGDHGHFICDLGVYSLHRVFRTILSEKLPDPDPEKEKKPTPKLLPWPPNTPLKDDFSDYFIQSNISLDEDCIIDFPEIDGSEPQSTNNVALFRMDKINRGVVVKSTQMSSFYREKFPFEKIWELFGDKDRQFTFDFFDFRVDSGVSHTSHLKFKGMEFFKKFVLEKNPACIHISSLKPPPPGKERRELVIDVDKTDYQNDYPFLNCCGKDDPLCSKCFNVIKLALLISSTYFRTILGYKDVRFFFSGKKGFHAWIFDEEVRNLDVEQHKKICAPLLKYESETMGFFSNYLHSLYSVRSLLEVLKKTFIIPEERKSTTTPLEFFWIKIDQQVSFSVSHTAKCPWAIHKSSRRQSFEINDIERFSFDDVK